MLLHFNLFKYLENDYKLFLTFVFTRFTPDYFLFDVPVVFLVKVKIYFLPFWFFVSRKFTRVNIFLFSLEKSFFYSWSRNGRKDCRMSLPLKENVTRGNVLLLLDVFLVCLSKVFLVRSDRCNVAFILLHQLIVCRVVFHSIAFGL